MPLPFINVKLVKLFAAPDLIRTNKAYKTAGKLLKLNLGDGEGLISAEQILTVCKGLFVWLLVKTEKVDQDDVIEKIVKLLTTNIKDENVSVEFIKSFFEILESQWISLSEKNSVKFSTLSGILAAAVLHWLDKCKRDDCMNHWRQLSNGFLVGDNERLRVIFGEALLQETGRLEGSNQKTLRAMVITDVAVAVRDTNGDFYDKVGNKLVSCIADNKDIDTVLLLESIKDHYSTLESGSALAVYCESLVKETMQVANTNQKKQQKNRRKSGIIGGISMDVEMADGDAVTAKPTKKKVTFGKTFTKRFKKNSLVPIPKSKNTKSLTCLIPVIRVSNHNGQVGIPENKINGAVQRQKETNQCKTVWKRKFRNTLF